MKQNHFSLQGIEQYFPPELLKLPIWSAWRLMTIDGKEKKVPFNPLTHKAAKVNKPEDFIPYLEAKKAVHAAREPYSGLGILLDTPYIGIDLDNKGGAVMTRESLTEDMQRYLDMFPGCYAELSPSGTGLHILGTGEFKPAWKNRVGKAFEVYQFKRFLTATGYVAREGGLEDLTPALQRFFENLAPAVTQDKKADSMGLDAAELLRRGEGDSKLLSLWGGSLSGYDSASSADFALCLKLAFYTGGDARAIDSLFRQSGLMREKWDAKHGERRYGEMTAQNALKAWNGKSWQPPQAQITKTDKNTVGGDDEGDFVESRSSVSKQSTMGESLAKLLKHELAFDPGREDWLIYQGNGLWAYVNKREALGRINHEIKKQVGNAGYTSNYLKGVTVFLEFQLASADWNQNTGLIPFKNGCLDLASRKLIPHDVQHRFTWQIPYDYQPGADCPKIVEWLKSCVNNHTDQFMLLMAFMRAVLQRRSDLQRYLEIIGPGGTGKSTFIRLCERLVGHNNCHSTELKHLENNRFETAKLHGKCLVTITDSQNYAGDVSVLKAITGGDSLRFEEKNKQAGTGFKFQGMLLIAANEPIGSKDYTSGLFRRRITVRFDRLVKPEERRDLEAEFSSELAGLINYLLDIDDDQMVNFLRDTATSVPTLSDTTRENLVATNPLVQWLDECCVYEPGKEIETPIGAARREAGNLLFTHQWLYPNYINFCDEFGIKPLALNRFVGLLVEVCQAQLGLEVSRNITRTGKTIKNLRLRGYGEEAASPLDKKSPGLKMPSHS